MSNFDVAILGGGLSGVLAAAWLRCNRPDYRVVLVEPGEPGAAFWAGGLKYLRTSAAFTDFLLETGLDFDVVRVRGGVYDNGQISTYPLSDRDQQEAVQRAHYLKTRGTHEGYTSDVMNFGGKTSTRYVLDYKALVRACLANPKLTVVRAPVTRIGDAFVIVDQVRLDARTIVSTLPLPLYLNMSGTPMESRPTLAHRWLHVFMAQGGTDALEGYDYVYTPTLPHVHRISRSEYPDRFQVEVNSSDRASDLMTWITEAAEVIGYLGQEHPTVVKIPGHILPSDMNGWKPPDNHIMLGRYSAWQPRATADQTFDNLKARSL